MQIYNRHTVIGRYIRVAYAILAISGVLGVGACASQSAGPGPENTGDDSAQKSSNEAPTNKTAVNEDAASTNQKSQSQTQQDTGGNEVALTAIKIVEECKSESYVQHEQQSRTSIQKGWEATQAQKFGVGFRDEGEYKKWSKSHNEVFTSVSDACLKLSNCAKANKVDSEAKCMQQAQRYDAWRGVAEDFAKNAKKAEYTQPPSLCSMTPSIHDSAQCYKKLADGIDNVCQSEDCSEASECFRGVYYLDGAMRQAESSCGFVGQALDTCRGYLAASQRRESEFKLCMEIFNELDADIVPTL